MNKINRGAGSTRVMMNRSKGLAERGYDVTIVTFKNRNVKKDINKVREMGRLDERVDVLNIYRYYQEKNTRSEVTEKQKEYYQKSAQVDEQDFQGQVMQTKRSAKYYEDGVYTKYKKWDKNGYLDYIDHFFEDKGTVREKFHKSGYVKKKVFYEPKDGKVRHNQYFTSDGFCFLGLSYANKHNTIEYILFDRDSSKEMYFSSTESFQGYWLEQLCFEQYQKPYVIVDKKECAPSVMRMKEGLAHQIYVIHKNHLKYPFEIGSPKRPEEQFLLDHLKDLDHVVFLTHQQKDDVIKEYGDYGNMHVIPNSVHHVSEEEVTKENKTVSLIARLTKTKQIDHAIDAFKKVTQKIPDARLEIYGQGGLKEDLKKRIKEHGLSQNVFLKGYTANTDAVYKKSIVTLLTSQSEAFAMVVAESMANGTPVISYDVNYGPSDIITNGKDGYLIKQDKEILADKIIDLLKKPKKAQKMGKKAKRNATRNFYEETVINQWVSLLETLRV